jgi:hypothetical protein
MMKNTVKLCVVILLITMSSCGVITKARYGNGLKLNVEFNGFKREKQKEKTTTIRVSRKDKALEKTVEKETLTEVVDTAISMVPSVSASIEKIADEEKNKVSKTKKFFNGAKKVIKAEVAKVVAQKPNKRNGEGPMEPNTLVAAILFYGSIVLQVALSFSEFAFIPGLSTVLSLCVLAGFILAIVGLHKHKRSDYAYSGYGLALSIVIIAGLYLLIALLLLIALIAIFSV